VFDFRLEQLPWRPDVILASPPCTAFSVMRIGRNWNHDHTPKNDTARLGLRLLEATLAIIREADPAYFVIENPMGKMRRMPQLAGLDHRHVTYCQYGETRMKPTDLWGGFPPSLVLAPPLQTRGHLPRGRAARFAHRDAGPHQLQQGPVCQDPRASELGCVPSCRG
jgi:hypothetical protein